MIFIFVVLVILNFTNHSIEVQSVFEGKDNLFPATPVAVTNLEKGFVVLDSDGNLWVFDKNFEIKHRFGGIGSGPGELNPIFTNMTTVDDNFQIYHRQGRRTSTFSTETGFIESRDHDTKGFLLYEDEGRKLELIADFTPGAPPSGKISFSQPQVDSKHINFPNNTNAARPTMSEIGCFIHDDKALIYTNATKSMMIYAIVLDLKTGIVLVEYDIPFGGINPEMGSHLQKQNFAITTVAGASFHPRWGFILTENQLRDQGNLVLHGLNPEEKEHQRIQIDLPEKANATLTHLHYLREDFWFAYDQENYLILKID